VLYEIVLDRGETPNKCTIAALVGAGARPDFRVQRVRGEAQLSALRAPILLHPDGECLTKIREEPGVLATLSALAFVDSTWSRLPILLKRIPGPLPRFARIPPGFVTAYPRHSKYKSEPEGGLATIEAIFIAAALLGKWDLSLFSRFHFAGEFLRLNRARFLQLGIADAESSEFPERCHRKRTSVERRLDRGKSLINVPTF
jgi:ribosome biogenesis protein Tsr3